MPACARLKKIIPGLSMHTKIRPWLAISLFTISSSLSSADWLTPVSISTSLASITPDHPLAIDSHSNASVAWVDAPTIGHNLFTADLASGASTWTSIELLTADLSPQFFYYPSLFMDKTDKVYADFLEFPMPFMSNGLIHHSQSQSFDQPLSSPSSIAVTMVTTAFSLSMDELGSHHALLAEGTICPFDIVFIKPGGDSITLGQDDSMLTPVVATSAKNGQSILLWKSNIPSLTLYAYRYLVSSDQLVPTSNIPLPIGTTSINQVAVALDPNGNAVALFNATVGMNNEIFASTLPAGSLSWSEPQLISNPGNQGKNLSIALDASGIAYLLWTEKPTNSQEFVRAGTLPLNGILTNVRDLTDATAPNTFVDPSMHIAADSFGNAVSIWCVNDLTTRRIQVSKQPKGDDWSAATTLSTTGKTPNIVLSDQGTAVAVWLNASTNFLIGTSNAFLFALESPVQFVGRVTKNAFLLHSEFRLTLNWQPSPAPNISVYQIRKNGKVIATIPGTGPLTFTTTLKGKKVSGKYTIVAIASNGNESLPLELTVK